MNDVNEVKEVSEVHEVNRFNKVNEKFEMTRMAREDKIKTRQELEREKADLAKMLKQKDRAQFLRTFIKKHQDLL